MWSIFTTEGGEILHSDFRIPLVRRHTLTKCCQSCILFCTISHPKSGQILPTNYPSFTNSSLTASIFPLFSLAPLSYTYNCPPNLIFSPLTLPQSVGFHVPPTPYHLCHGTGWPALLLLGPSQREEIPHNIHFYRRGFVR